MTTRFNNPTSKLNEKDLNKAIAGSGGIISTVAQRLGMSREHVSRYFSKHPEWRDKLEEELASMIDVGENRLFKKVEAGEWKPLQFFLRTKGKNRGYVERQEVQQENVVKGMIIHLSIDGKEVLPLVANDRTVIDQEER